LNICLRIGIKIPEQPFIIKPGISSSPTDVDGFSLFMALQTSSSEIRASDRNSDDCGREGNNNYNFFST
jgi:hypothetical protein